MTSGTIVARFPLTGRRALAGDGCYAAQWPRLRLVRPVLRNRRARRHARDLVRRFRVHMRPTSSRTSITLVLHSFRFGSRTGVHTRRTVHVGLQVLHAGFRWFRTDHNAIGYRVLEHLLHARTGA